MLCENQRQWQLIVTITIISNDDIACYQKKQKKNSMTCSVCLTRSSGRTFIETLVLHKRISTTVLHTTPNILLLLSTRFALLLM
mmetsp:Transcript_7488/g.16135  ORF Transcript_7488/g.16135 Transcript_7488/m.16135 type:complete len:84 (-) Transcript_7488:38-289(-)